MSEEGQKKHKVGHIVGGGDEMKARAESKGEWTEKEER
jgi:hypothetical protein